MFHTKIKLRYKNKYSQLKGSQNGSYWYVLYKIKDK